MEKDFISIYDSMPPLNRLCEVKLKNKERTMNARFLMDIKTLYASWKRQREDGILVRVPPVASWRIMETEEDTTKWLLQGTVNTNDSSSDT